LSATDETAGRAGTEPGADAPRLWRRLLTWLSALVLIGLMVGGGHLLLRLEPELLPVRVVSIEGEVRRLPLEQLQERVSEHLSGGIVTQDLAVLKEAVEDLAWVDTASLRRVWPDRLVLSVREHAPLARWGADGLVTAEGVVFRPESGELPHGLAQLAGSDGQAPEVVARFRDWRPRFEALGLGILDLELDARGAWTLETDAGFNLLLGKRAIDGRLERFLSAYPALAAAGQPQTVDMRYSNGLAVSWRGSGEGRGPSADGHAQAAVPASASPAARQLSWTGLPAAETVSTSTQPRPSALGPRPSRS
jgi:cell division protein FtsQ